MTNVDRRIDAPAIEDESARLAGWDPAILERDSSSKQLSFQGTPNGAPPLSTTTSRDLDLLSSELFLKRTKI